MESVDKTTIPEDKVNELESKLEAVKAELKDMATMGAVITSIQEIDAVLSVVMETAIQLVRGEVGLIMLEEDGELANKISWGINLEFVSTLMYEDDLDIATYTFQNKKPVILSELGLVSDEGMQLESIISTSRSGIFLRIFCTEPIESKAF